MRTRRLVIFALLSLAAAQSPPLEASFGNVSRVRVDRGEGPHIGGEAIDKLGECITPLHPCILDLCQHDGGKIHVLDCTNRSLDDSFWANEEAWRSFEAYNITVIDLTGNLLTGLGLDLTHTELARLPSLEELRLRQNLLKPLVQSQLVEISSRLRKLDLSWNNMSRLFKHPNEQLIFHNLEELDLSGNNLGSYLDPRVEPHTYNLISYHRKLEKLDLSNNNITVLHDFLFADMISLKSLNLSSNSITDIDAISLNKDKHFYASLHHYGWQHRPVFLLRHGLLSVETLDVSNNRIQSPDINMLKGLRTLKTLRLDHNNWTCDADLYMFQRHWMNSGEFAFTVVPVDGPGVMCQRPEEKRQFSIFNFTCVGSCLVTYDTYEHPKAPSPTYYTSIILSVIALLALFSMVVCYKWKIWQKLGFGHVKYKEVRRNLVLEMEINEANEDDPQDLIVRAPVSAIIHEPKLSIDSES